MTTLVLMPGMDGTGELFSSFIKSLPDNYNATIVTYPRDKVLTRDQYLDRIKQACEGIQSFVLVAESFSTPHAIEFAAKNPERITALVICAGFVSAPVKGLKGLLPSLSAPILFRLQIPAFVVRMFLVGSNASDELIRSVRHAISSVGTNVLLSRLKLIRHCNVLNALSQLGLPILYIQAAQDRLIKSDSFNEIRSIQPTITLIKISGPHLILQREPKQCAESLIQFVEKIHSKG
jgi:pimeloyl-ACP methyl ester carboxylesterase